jgi:transcriptional regulator GlxA family with amidase domain
MNRIAIVLYDGFDALDAIGPWEVLRKAEKLGAPVSPRFVAREGSDRIESSDGLSISDFESLERDESPWILVPGGAWAARTPIGAWGEIERGELPRLLAARRAAGAKFASVCTGAMILAAAGMTRGRAMTTHAVAKAALAGSGARVVDARVVDDGDLVSAGGVTSGIDLGLWMTERLGAVEIAERVRRTIEWLHAPSVERAA